MVAGLRAELERSPRKLRPVGKVRQRAGFLQRLQARSAAMLNPDEIEIAAGLLVRQRLSLAPDDLQGLAHIKSRGSCVEEH